MLWHSGKGSPFDAVVASTNNEGIQGSGVEGYVKRQAACLAFVAVQRIEPE